MDIALCYESVLPARGGAETYIGDLSRKLARDGHSVHLYAARWDASALPAATHFHRVAVLDGPRFLRPWRFAVACEKLLSTHHHDVSIGFDKTWGQDILYPQGGLHAASAAHNLLKYPTQRERSLAAIGKWLDPAARSFARLERKQYLSEQRPTIVVNSRMVQRHFEEYYDIPPESLRVIPSAIDPDRFHAEDRFRRRQEERDRWGTTSSETTGLFVATNYRLKGLAPLLNAVALLPKEGCFKLIVAGNSKYAKYERLAKKLGIGERVHFLGHLADPRDAYFAADFLVHPTFYDPCSLVVLEAIACGLPVVTSRFNGAAELLSPPLDSQVVFDPHDAPALAQALTAMLDGGYRSSAAQAARQSALRWTFEHHYRAMLNVMLEVSRLRRAA